MIERFVFSLEKTVGQHMARRITAGFYAAVLHRLVFFARDFTIASRMLTGMFGGHANYDMILSTSLQIGIVTAGLIHALVMRMMRLRLP